MPRLVMDDGSNLTQEERIMQSQPVSQAELLLTPENATDKPKLVLFFGNVRPNEYASFKNAGYKLGLFYRKHHYLPRPVLDDFAFITEFNHNMDVAPLVASYQNIVTQYDVLHHINVREDTVPQFARFAQALNIASTSPEDAINARDKTLMKAAFKQQIGEHATSAFAQVNNEADVIQFAQHHSWPLILKPTNLHASKFVSINYTLAELLTAYKVAAEQISALNQLDRNRETDLKAETFTSQGETTYLQIEEFMQGTNHSVDCIIDQQGNVYATPVVDVLVGIEIGKADFHHFARQTPSILPTDNEQATRDMAIAGCKALNLKSCIAHVELIFTQKGPQLIEISARPGGNRAEILKLCYGVDLMTLFLQCLEGVKPPTSFTPLQHAAIVTPFPEQPGVVTELFFDSAAQQLTTLNNLLLKVKPGDRIGPAIAGYMAPAYFWLCSDNLTAIQQDIQRIASTTLFHCKAARQP